MRSVHSVLVLNSPIWMPMSNWQSAFGSSTGIMSPLVSARLTIDWIPSTGVFCCEHRRCCLVVDQIYFLVHVRCPFAVAVEADSYFQTDEDVRPDQEITWSLSTALHHVLTGGEKQAWYKYCNQSALLLVWYMFATLSVSFEIFLVMLNDCAQCMNGRNHNADLGHHCLCSTFWLLYQMANSLFVTMK